MGHKFDIRDCAEIMDEVIKSSSEHVSEDLRKSISFNPLHPTVVTPDMMIHNPYFFVPGDNGGFAPHHSSHFADRGSMVSEKLQDLEGYRMNDKFWNDAGWAKYRKSMGKLRGLTKSIDRLIQEIE